MRGDFLTLALPGLAVAAVLNLLHPVGYVGGGFDDYHYLQAVRCVAEQGWCIPQDHWARRFPLVLPVALTMRLFGETREVLWIVPALASAAAIVLLVAIVNRAFGARPALLAGIVFAGGQLVAGRVLSLGVDMVEIALALGAIACLLERRAVAAGLLLGLAIQCRPTMLALGPPILLFIAREPRLVLRLGIGVFVPLAVEAVLYWIMLGDPLAPWKLSLAHTTIPSSELNGVDLSRSPILNPDFIAGWRPAAGIPAHWSIQAIVNYLAHPELLIANLMLLGLLALGWRRVDRRIGMLLGAAALFFLQLVFVFAIDPKPRMFLPVFAAQCAVIGVLATSVSRGVIAVFLAIFGIGSVAAAYAWPDRQAAAEIVAARLRADPTLEIDAFSARSLALLGRDWPIWDGAGARVISMDGHLTGIAGLRLVRTEELAPSEPAVIRWLRDRRLFAAPRKPMRIKTFVREAAGGAPLRAP